jgi:hypothetical protein
MISLATEKTDTKEYRRSSSLYFLIVIIASFPVCLSLHSPPQLMCALALSVYGFFKIATLCEYQRRPSISSAVAYLLLWPGMNPVEFFDRKQCERNQSGLWGILSALCGTTLLWLIIPALGSIPNLLKGTLGLAGFALLFHFGLFAVAAAYHQSRGRAVTPLMRAPWRASSVSDFWANRWNTAFNQLIEFCGGRAATRRFGGTATLFLAFLASGLIHELMISVPAGGGYGGPTIYFLVQAVGISVEKRYRGFLKRNRALARICAWAIIIIPVPLLFHAPFLTRVIAPLVDSIQLPNIL